MTSSEAGRKLRALGVGRFQVMALLQAARYYRLTGDLDRAKSFGLNRAIFYAWAKHYGSKQPRVPSVESEIRSLLRGDQQVKCPEGFTEVLGECIKISPRGFYEIGDVEQTPRDFEDQVVRRLKPVLDPEKAWKAALDYVSRFPEWVLKDPARFYKYVYEPVRDVFFVHLLERDAVQPPQDVLERLKSLEEVVEKAKKAQKTLVDFSR